MTVEVGTKFDQGGHHTAANGDRHEVLVERDARIQEFTDIGGAVMAVQDVVFGMESIVVQRLESHRVNEVKDELRIVARDLATITDLQAAVSRRW